MTKHSVKKQDGLNSLLSLDDIRLENSYLAFPEHFYHRVNPKGLKNAHLISFNPEVAHLLDLDPCKIKPSDLARYFGGETLLRGSEPVAMKYSGHQFGVYNPDLGDGRGVLLGEVKNTKDERWDIHLKGAGQTRYSRFGDGKAVLRSSIREYLISEAMHALGIPSTRALCLLGSEEYTMREGMEPCAMVLRVTQSHIRFGHFEHFFYTRQHDALKELADYCIERYFPELVELSNSYLAFFKEIRDRSIDMVAKWQTYGFVHGVMNTDNMSILGETFDYGPFTFMDEFNPDFVSSHTDHEGRYAFKKQPDIMLWNLSCLAQALLPLIEKEELITALDEYKELYLSAYYKQMSRRLGLLIEQESDRDLIDRLVFLFQHNKLDMHRFHRGLCSLDKQSSEPVTDSISDSYILSLLCVAGVESWLDAYRQRLLQEASSTPIWQQQMRSVNPCYVLRNYMAEEAIKEAHQGDYQLVNELQAVLRNPFESREQFTKYAEAPPDWASGICLSCSS